MNRKSFGGMAVMMLGIGFNIPYIILATIYDYPQILRASAADALTRFADGGTGLIIAWYAFMLTALALVPVSVALTITPARLAKMPALALGAMIAGTMAGITQAIGLARWVFVVPQLASHASDRSAQSTFETLNAYGGVAVGENLGQLLTALFLFQMAMLQRREGAKWLCLLAAISGTAITVGTGEGVAIAIGTDGSAFSVATVAGFMGLSVWLVSTGASMIASSRTAQKPA